MTTPEMQLWTMVMVQAISDLHGARTGCSGRDRQRLATAARDWIMAPEMSVGSFIWLANQLGADPQTLRRKIFALTRASVKAAIQENHTMRGEQDRKGRRVATYGDFEREAG